MFCKYFVHFDSLYLFGDVMDQVELSEEIDSLITELEHLPTEKYSNINVSNYIQLTLANMLQVCTEMSEGELEKLDRRKFDLSALLIRLYPTPESVDRIGEKLSLVNRSFQELGTVHASRSQINTFLRAKNI